MYSSCYAICEYTAVLCNPFLGNGSVNTLEEPVTNQRIVKHTTLGVVGNGVFCSVRAKWSQ
jgi:hypothetical protein